MTRAQRIRQLIVPAAALIIGHTGLAAATPQFWYDDEFNPLPGPSGAVYHAVFSDPRDSAGRPAELRRVDNDALRMRGYVDPPAPGDKDLNWVGHYELYWENDDNSLREVGTYGSQDRLQGVLVSYDEQGRLKAKNLYLDGELHGEQRQYLHGDLYSISHYAHGKREGVHAQYARGKLRRIEEYHDGELDGVTEQYFIGPEQTLRSRVEYRHGKVHGWSRLYHGDGTLEREVHSVDGRKDGVARTWHDQAANQVSELEHYRDGERVGEHLLRRYNADDYVTFQQIRDADDTLISQTRYNSFTGRPQSRERHLEDPERDIRETFDNNGHVHVRRTFFEDQARRIEVRFTADGRMSYRREQRDHHPVGLFIEPALSGGTVRGRYDDEGRRHGTEIETLDGRPIRVTTYVHGQRNGPFYELSANGRRTVAYYVDDALDGVYEVTDGNGRTIERARYDHGDRVGDGDASAPDHANDDQR